MFTSFSALVLGVTLYALTREQDPDLAMLGLVCRVADRQGGRPAAGAIRGAGMTKSLAALILPPHILAGVLALAFGYVALFSVKGLTLHRKSGMLFFNWLWRMRCKRAVLGGVGASTLQVTAIEAGVSR